MALDLEIGHCSLVGSVRLINEDSVDVRTIADSMVCLVADGMGGQAAGEVASQQAVKIIPRELGKYLSRSTSIEDAKNIICRSVVQANEEIIAMSELDRELKNMGTTLAMTVWRRGTNQMFIAALGDSRIYFVRGQKIQQLTVDHSIAQALVEANTISPAEALVHPYRHRLWKYLGTSDVGNGPEVKLIHLEPGDRFLLCSDGLSGPVSDSELLAELINMTDAGHCADRLCHQGIEKGSRDNVSCVTILVREKI